MRRGRSGQIVLYLLLVLVGITLLALMNAGLFVSVSNRNRTMNAGDAAALAVARHQGELLNRIGQLNIDHLKAALKGDTNACAEITREQAILCFLGPLEGIRIGNEWAQRNGIDEPDEEAVRILREHAADIRTVYALDTEQYPEPWEGAWLEYATTLETYLASGLCAAPDNIDFRDAVGNHVLLSAQFYNAVAGRSWCWFRLNAPGLAENYVNFRDWPPLPSPDDETRLRRACNSEIYSLHLICRQGSALSLIGKDAIARLIDEPIPPESFLDSSLSLLNDTSQTWYFFDTTDSGLWRTWWEIDPDGDWEFPVVGKVKPEYDVRGCAACCRVIKSYADVVAENTERTLRWTAAAKPFGLVDGPDGQPGLVTGENGLVLPAFTDVRLVPWDSVGGRDTERPCLDMVKHIRDHLPRYLQSGTTAISSQCFYCAQLIAWERPSIHSEARSWLIKNAKTCRRSTGGSSGRGGTPHGH